MARSAAALPSAGVVASAAATASASSQVATLTATIVASPALSQTVYSPSWALAVADVTSSAATARRTVLMAASMRPRCSHIARPSLPVIVTPAFALSGSRLMREVCSGPARIMSDGRSSGGARGVCAGLGAGERPSREGGRAGWRSVRACVTGGSRRAWGRSAAGASRRGLHGFVQGMDASEQTPSASPTRTSRRADGGANVFHTNTNAPRCAPGRRGGGRWRECVPCEHNRARYPGRASGSAGRPARDPKAARRPASRRRDRKARPSAPLTTPSTMPFTSAGAQPSASLATKTRYRVARAVSRASVAASRGSSTEPGRPMTTSCDAGGSSPHGRSAWMLKRRPTTCST